MANKGRAEAGKALEAARVAETEAASQRPTAAQKQKQIAELEERAQLFGDPVKQSVQAKVLERKWLRFLLVHAEEYSFNARRAVGRAGEAFCDVPYAFCTRDFRTRKLFLSPKQPRPLSLRPSGTLDHLHPGSDIGRLATTSASKGPFRRSVVLALDQLLVLHAFLLLDLLAFFVFLEAAAVRRWLCRAQFLHCFFLHVNSVASSAHDGGLGGGSEGEGGGGEGSSELGHKLQVFLHNFFFFFESQCFSLHVNSVASSVHDDGLGGGGGGGGGLGGGGLGGGGEGGGGEGGGGDGGGGLGGGGEGKG
eukprot:scaffold57191_cov64-Phaeocystis_antarctica.AAC.6